MDLLSNLQRKYHELLNPVQQGLSNIGKAFVNTNPAARGISNIVNSGQNLLSNPQFQSFSKPIINEGKNFVIQQAPAAVRLSPPGQLVQSYQNLVNPNFNPTQNAINQGKDLFQGGKFVANVVGGPKLFSKAGASMLGINAGLGAGINKVMGGSLLEGAGQGVANTPSLLGITSATNPLIEKYTAMLAPKVAPGLVKNPIGKYLTTSAIRGLQNVPEGSVINAALGQNPLDPSQAALNFASGFIPGKTGINGKVDINPNAPIKRLPKGDLEGAANALERLAMRDDMPYFMKQRKNDQELIRTLAAEYIGKRFAKQKDFQVVAQEVANRVRVDQGMGEITLPGGMGLIDNGEFKPPYKKGDITYLKKGLNDLLGRSKPLLGSRLDELEAAAKSGDENAIAHLDLVRSVQGDLEKAQASKSGLKEKKIVKVRTQAQIKAENNPNEYYHASQNPGIKELKASKDGTLGAGVYLAKDESGAKVYAAHQGDGNIDDVGSYKVKVSSDNIYKTTKDYLEPQEVAKIKSKGYEGIETPNETVIFDPKKTEIKGYTAPGSYTNTRADQIATKFRKVEPFEAAMEAQVGKPMVLKPSARRQPLKLKGDIPQYSQNDSNFQGGQAHLNAEENMGRFKDMFAKWVGKRDAAQTTGTQLGAKFKDIAPSETRGFAKKVETGQETRYSTEVRNELDKVFDNAKANGIELGYRENYLPHVWDKSETQVIQDYKTFKRREGFQNERVLPTYEEGIQMGLSPKYKTVGELLTDYGTRVERLKANLDFFKQMKDEGFIVDTSIGARQPGFKALDGPGFPRSISRGADGKEIIGSYYAPAEVADKINKVFSPSESPKILSTLRKVSGVVQDVTLSGGAPGTPFNAFTVAQAQKELLAGRLRSPIDSFFRSISPGRSTKFFEENVGQIKKMQERNIPITSSFDIGNLVKGGDKGNIWNRAVNDPTFKRFMPQLQINLFNDIEKQALKGGRSTSEAADIAARAVKQFYGVTGSEKEILRGQLGKDILGTTTFAPKFRESMINFWINSVKALKNPTALENRANIKFLAGSALTLGAMDFLNNQLNGHHMWDNPKGKEDKLLIPKGDGTVIGIPFLSSIATIPRAIVREGGLVAKGDIKGAAIDAGSTYASIITKPIFDVMKNSDYFGKEIVSENDNTSEKFGKIGKYMLTQYLAHPYLKETLDPRNTDDPMYQRISRALELPIRYYSQKSIDSAPYFAAKDEAYKKLDKIQQSAFDAIPKQDPNDVQARQFKYLTMMQYPQVFNAKKEIALKSDKNVDPLYTVPYSQARVYMLYEAQNPGSADKKALYKAHPEIGQLAKARSDFFTANPIEGGQTSGAPRPSARAQKLMDAGNFKDSEVKAFLDANTAYQNQQRAQLGLTALAGYTPYQKKPKTIKLKAISLKLPKGKKIKKVKLASAKKVKQYKLAKVTKVKRLKA